NVAGTVVARTSGSPGSVIVRRWLRPESGATGLTGAEKSKTTRVFVGADDDRSPVSVVAVVAVAPAGPAAATSGAVPATVCADAGRTCVALTIVSATQAI